MMKNKLFYSLLLIFLSISLSACTPQMIKETKIGDDKNNKKVLIATQKSEFKEAVVYKVAEALGKDGYFVKIINLEKLIGEPTEKYSAIVIVNDCWAHRLNEHVREFLKNVPMYEEYKIILLTTAMNENWKPTLTGIDAITSASQMDKATPIAETIINKIRSLSVIE